MQPDLSECELQLVINPINLFMILFMILYSSKRITDFFAMKVQCIINHGMFTNLLSSFQLFSLAILLQFCEK